MSRGMNMQSLLVPSPKKAAVVESTKATNKRQRSSHRYFLHNFCVYVCTVCGFQCIRMLIYMHLCLQSCAHVHVHVGTICSHIAYCTCIFRPKTTSGPMAGPKLNSRQTRRPQSVGLSDGRSTDGAISRVQPITIDVENTVQRIEKALVDDGGTSLPGGEVIYGYHDDDVLPETAQDMGSGNAT